MMRPTTNITFDRRATRETPSNSTVAATFDHSTDRSFFASDLDLVPDDSLAPS